MIALGRSAQSDSATADLIAALAGGDFYARWLALQSCYGSHDGAQIQRALADPSQLIRSAALRLLGLFCDDARVLAALPTLHPKQQQSLLKLLRERRRFAVIDAFLQQVDGAALSQFLPYASPALFAQLAERGTGGV